MSSTTRVRALQIAFVFFVAVFAWMCTLLFMSPHSVISRIITGMAAINVMIWGILLRHERRPRSGATG